MFRKLVQARLELLLLLALAAANDPANHDSR